MPGPTRLERALTDGRFAITAELGPPKHADPSALIEKATLLAPICDGVNITDNQTAQSRMSPIAAGKLVLDAGAEPVMQITVRDRNRMAITSDLLGASALGIHNTLSMSGDPIHIGNHPDTTVVNDIDTMQLLQLQGSLRSGHFANEAAEELPGPAPHLHIGATANPFAPDADVEISKIRAKMEAGADFFQTQITYMPDALESFLVRLRDADLPSWPKLIIGVGPFKHLKMAIHMRDKVWGVEVPDELIKRMEQTSDEGEEGKRICIEIIERLTAMDDIAGCHVMAVAWEESIPEILDRAGLTNR